eukprot:jgi/Mesvir1/9841/Mv22383-RA.1
MASVFKDVATTFAKEYTTKTPTKLKIIDCFIGYAVVTCLIQVAYMALVGSFPFNAFLAGTFSCVGSAVLAACLRMQVNEENKDFKDKVSPERAFADFAVCSLVLFFVAINFMG